MDGKWRVCGFQVFSSRVFDFCPRYKALQYRVELHFRATLPLLDHAQLNITTCFQSLLIARTTPVARHLH